MNGMKLGSPFSMDIQLRSYVMAEDTAMYVRQKRAFYEGLNGMTLKEIIRNKKPIDSLFSMKAVDSLIRVNLELERADTVFGFGLIDLDRNKIAYHARVKDSSDLRRSTCYVSLFTDNRFMTPYKLVLLVPDTNSVLVSIYIYYCYPF